MTQIPIRTQEPRPWNVWGLQNLCCIFLLVLNNFNLILNILNIPNENLNKVKQCWDNFHPATPTRISPARVTSTWSFPTQIVLIWSISDLENPRSENSRLGWFGPGKLALGKFLPENLSLRQEIFPAEIILSVSLLIMKSSNQETSNLLLKKPTDHRYSSKHFQKSDMVWDMV